MDLTKINREVFALADTFERLNSAIQESDLSDREKEMVMEKFKWPEAANALDPWRSSLIQLFKNADSLEMAAMLSNVDMDDIEVMLPDD